MRTTIDIPDNFYRKVKGKALKEGTSVKALVLLGLEQVMRGSSRSAKPHFVTLPLVKSKRPGSRPLLTGEQIDEIMFS
jgi:hypothetical protein